MYVLIVNENRIKSLTKSERSSGFITKQNPTLQRDIPHKGDSVQLKRGAKYSQVYTHKKKTVLLMGSQAGWNSAPKSSEMTRRALRNELNTQQQHSQRKGRRPKGKWTRPTSRERF